MSAASTERVSAHRVFGDAGAQRPPAPAMNSTRAQRRLAILADALDHLRDRRRHRRRPRLQLLVEHEPRRHARRSCSTISRRRPGRAVFGSILSMIDKRLGDVGAAPARAGIGDLEIAARRRFAAAHADAGRRHVEEAAGLVLGQHAGDVVVDDDHLVDMAVPLLGEDADRRRAAADAHALLAHAVDDRRLARPHDDRRAAVDRELDRAPCCTAPASSRR